VERVELERVRQRQRVLRHVADLVLLVRHRGLAHVAVVEDHRPVARRERLELEGPGQRVGREAHHAEQGLALAVHLVVQLLAVGLQGRHQSLLGKIV
jgi:hypothetical protein